MLSITAMPCAAQGTSSSNSEVFPMETGTRWTYRGEVVWQGGADNPRIHRANMTWAMRVVDSFEDGRFKIALLSGHPRDLIWYESGRKPGCDLLIRVNGSRFYLRECGPADSREKLDLRTGDIAKLVDEDNLIFKLPLRAREVYGQDPDVKDKDVKRKDSMYGWFVDAIGPLAWGRPRAFPQDLGLSTLSLIGRIRIT